MTTADVAIANRQIGALAASTDDEILVPDNVTVIIKGEVKGSNAGREMGGGRVLEVLLRIRDAWWARGTWVSGFGEVWVIGGSCCGIPADDIGAIGVWPGRRRGGGERLLVGRRQRVRLATGVRQGGTRGGGWNEMSSDRLGYLVLQGRLLCRSQKVCRISTTLPRGGGDVLRTDTRQASMSAASIFN